MLPDSFTLHGRVGVRADTSQDANAALARRYGELETAVAGLPASVSVTHGTLGTYESGARGRRGMPSGLRVAARVTGVAEAVHMPHLCPVEVCSVLRGLVRGRKMQPREAEVALGDLLRLQASRHPVEPLLGRMWELRHNLTTYDAAYVALAEVLDAPLLTSDRKMAPSYRRYAEVEVIA